MLTLTRPKEPELETAHRVRAIRIKSSAELEEEMLSKIPKFKARPINKKVFFHYKPVNRTIIIEGETNILYPRFCSFYHFQFKNIIIDTNIV